MNTRDLWRSENCELQSPYKKLLFKGSASETKTTWPVGPWPWSTLFCWGKCGMSVFRGCDSDLSIPTKLQQRQSSEEWTGNAPAQSRSHIANTSLTFGAALQVWGSHSCWWRLGATGAAVKAAHSFPCCYRDFPAADHVGRHSSHVAPTSLTPRLNLTPSLPLEAFLSAGTWHVFGFILLFLPFCHCICYSLLIYKLL